MNIDSTNLNPFLSDFQPVVILGAPRSGTNLLRDGLCSQKSVGSWDCDEINLLWRTGNALHPNDQLTPSMVDPAQKRRIRKAFVSVAKQNKVRFVVEKTCANSLRVGFVDCIVPEAKYVFIVRDGYDVVASALKRWVAPVDILYTLKKLRNAPLADLPYYSTRFLNNYLHRLRNRESRVKSWGPRFEGLDQLLATVSLAEVCAHQWKACVEATERDLANIPPQRVMRLHYEQLVSQPAETLIAVSEFLGIDPQLSVIEQFANGVFASSVGTGRRQLSQEQLDAIQPLIESVTVAHGTSAHAA